MKPITFRQRILRQYLNRHCVLGSILGTGSVGVDKTALMKVLVEMIINKYTCIKTR